LDSPVSVPIHPILLVVEGRTSLVMQICENHDFHGGFCCSEIEKRYIDDSTGFAKPIQ
jgi:hypothetical protein